MPPCPNCFLSQIDFASERRGVTCGYRWATSLCDREPFCFFTNDGGATWSESRLRADLDGLRITTLVMSANGSGALATADDRDCGDAETTRGVLLQSTDGGSTWRLSDPPIDGPFRATAVVRAAAR